MHALLRLRVLRAEKEEVSVQLEGAVTRARALQMEKEALLQELAARCVSERKVTG